MWINEIYSSDSTNTKIVTFIFALCITYFLCVFSGVWKRKQNNITKVPGFPFIGNLLLFIPVDKACRKVDACINEYGSILELWILNHRIVVVADITVAKEVLMKRPKTFCRARLEASANNMIQKKTLLLL